jgi:hypothetical protein
MRRMIRRCPLPSPNTEYSKLEPWLTAVDVRWGTTFRLFNRLRAGAMKCGHCKKRGFTPSQPDGRTTSVMYVPVWAPGLFCAGIAFSLAETAIEQVECKSTIRSSNPLFRYFSAKPHVNPG